MPKKGSMAKKEAKKEKGASKMPPFNITEHKPMEEEMRKLSSAIEQSIDGIAIADLEPKLTYVNDAFARMHGYSREEMMGMKVVNLHNEEQMDEYQRSMNQTKTQGSWEGEIGRIRKDGTPFATYMSVTLLKGDDGKPKGIAAVTTDITEHKPTEEALGQSEELYRNMIELSPDSIVAVDTKGVILLCNSAATRILGYSKDEMVGKRFSKIGIIRARDMPRYLKLFSSVLRGKIHERLEFTFRHKDGTIFLAEVRAGFLKVGGKTIIQASARDITDRKRAEEALRAANKELREAQEKLVRSERLAAIGQLAGGVGHELRNPLGAIKNAAYYVKGKVAKSELAHKEPRVIEFLNIMDDEINTSNQIINDLLGFSRVGKPSVLPAQIKDVIEDALSPTIIPESIKLIKKLDTELPQIEIDASQIHQVLVNIITNAVQAMAEGGKLTIAAREKESFLEVEIADTGCGIPEEAANKIFDPLFTTRAKGIGLGLAVCKTIIDRHEGNIEVKSQAGKGTTFTIKLPLKRE